MNWALRHGQILCRQKGRILRGGITKWLCVRKAENNGVLRDEGLQVPWQLELVKRSSRKRDWKHKLQPGCRLYKIINPILKYLYLIL